MSNMYQWINQTWNTIRGKCGYECGYCYVPNTRARKLYEKEPELIETAFKPLGSGKIIFVCSMIDIFGPSIQDYWIQKTMEHCRKYDNLYLFQSKNPIQFFRFANDLPKRNILATTIETNRDYKNTKAPSVHQRMKGLKLLSEVGQTTMLTIEPIMDFDLKEFLEMIRIIKPYKVNIGADSKKSSLPEPTWEKIQVFIEELEKSMQVNLKPNLNRLKVIRE